MQPIVSQKLDLILEDSLLSGVRVIGPLLRICFVVAEFSLPALVTLNSAWLTVSFLQEIPFPQVFLGTGFLRIQISTI